MDLEIVVNLKVIECPISPACEAHKTFLWVFINTQEYTMLPRCVAPGVRYCTEITHESFFITGAAVYIDANPRHAMKWAMASYMKEAKCGELTNGGTQQSACRSRRAVASLRGFRLAADYTSRPPRRVVGM